MTTPLDFARYFLDVLAPESGCCVITGDKDAGKTGLMQTIAHAILSNRAELYEMGYGHFFILTTNTYTKTGKNPPSYPDGMHYVNDMPDLFLTWARLKKQQNDASFVFLGDEAQKIMGAVRANSSMEYSFLNFIDEARHFGIRLVFATPNLSRLLPAIKDEAKLIVQSSQDPSIRISPEEDMPVYVSSYIRKYASYNEARAKKYGGHPKNYCDVYYLRAQHMKINSVHRVLNIAPSPWVIGTGKYQYQTHAIDAFGLGTVTVSNSRGDKEVPFDIRDFLKWLGGHSSSQLPTRVIEYFNQHQRKDDFGDDYNIADLLRVLFNYGFKPSEYVRLWEKFDIDKSYVYRIRREWEENNVHSPQYSQGGSGQ